MADYKISKVEEERDDDVVIYRAEFEDGFAIEVDANSLSEAKRKVELGLEERKKALEASEIVE